MKYIQLVCGLVYFLANRPNFSFDNLTYHLFYRTEQDKTRHARGLRTPDLKKLCNSFGLSTLSPKSRSHSENEIKALSLGKSSLIV